MKATYETYNILLESSLIGVPNWEIVRKIDTVPYASEAQVFRPEVIKLISKEFSYDNQFLWDHFCTFYNVFEQVFIDSTGGSPLQ